MKYLILMIFLTISIVYGSPNSKDTIDLRAIVEKINGDPESTWTADTYGFKSLNVQEFVKSKLGAKLRKTKVEDFHKLKNSTHENEEALNFEKAKLGGLNIFLPKSYDARQKYPYCQSIKTVRDQSNCGSCWAVSAASVLSDRICIKSKGKYNMSLSANFVTACNTENYGCQGGYLDEVWNFFEEDGCITGDAFESDVGCQPYSIRPCGYPKKLACGRDLSLTPKCKEYACSNEWYGSPTETELFLAKNSGPVNDGFLGIFNEFWMRNEIYNNGPIQVGFWVFEDFLAYRKGIYQHRWRLFEWPLGGHAVKIVGWGEENRLKYWVIANSWGEEWGEDGFFRIVRGRHNCFIESEAYAGEAVLPPVKIGGDEKSKQ